LRKLYTEYNFNLIRQNGLRISEDFLIGQSQTRTVYYGHGNFVQD